MKVVLLAAACSIHAIRWANGLTRAGLDVHLITQHPPTEAVDERVKVIEFPFRGSAGYWLMVPGVRRLLEKLKPDVLSAHFASGYGTTARLVGFHPWVLSVWGSDVYDFPARSPVHRWWVRKNLRAADRVASTSRCMAEQTRRIAPELGDIAITPFGVDVVAYSREMTLRDDRGGDAPVVVGTVKSLAPHYGVDTLIRAFAMARATVAAEDATQGARLRLRLVGDGPEREALEQLAAELGVADVTQFVGRVPHAQVPVELAKLDIYVALSRRESFGVAILEAGAAGRPVVVSDAGGLPEVVTDGETGLVVRQEDPAAAAEAIKRLVLDPELRARMGAAGLAHVSREYSWDASVGTMIGVLKETQNSLGMNSSAGALRNE